MLKGWRTIIFNAATLALLIINAAAGQHIIPATWLPFVAPVVAGINFILRFITTTPVGNPAPLEQ